MEATWRQRERAIEAGRNDKVIDNGEGQNIMGNEKNLLH
jgi:hypothetical protein